MGLGKPMEQYITRQERVTDDAMGALMGDRIYHWRKILSEEPPMSEDGTPMSGEPFDHFMRRQKAARDGLKTFINQGIK